ncbi:hypothetical protein GUITHDRAFT_81153 [Guillardia theta CCMP2712]|uniref:protein O-GlcNAc transferase n=1 Tax=Guillardia theta (strain CCMP2712) TaxID=905079 RepID=L1ID93_GUITC|nr:hypothetical protein GUITHDRAFT_81153 [Guillardia theta CCMP2712]EKX33775.1 hypothetical protein GUITHDRAFT_81153 [Guillardia theta CCMP2712]|eukprot:XP_005820755.1 hypothetical protein GUITHDRAFT_81153 [Guillardia theta CCMP2712]
MKSKSSLSLALLLLLCCLDSSVQQKKSKSKRGGGGDSGAILKAKFAAQEGAAALDKGNFQLAMSKYQRAVEMDPGYSDYHTQLATALRAMGRKDEAARSYEAAISMMDEPRNKAGGDQYWAAVHINLGYLYAEGGGGGLFEGAMALAAEKFKVATQLIPQFGEAYTYWGNAYQEMGRWQEALDVFMLLLERVPASSMEVEKQATAHFHIANCWGALGKTDKSLEAYKEATRINPKFAAAYTNMGTIHQGRKHNELARESLELAVKIDPELAEAYTNLGIAIQDLGDSETAVRLTELAIRLKPSMGAGYNNWGRALENSQQLEKALEAYKLALKHGSSSFADAFCAKVYLEHFLCGWNTLSTDMRQVSKYLEENLHPSQASNEPCVQPFRAFAYPLSPILFMNVTKKVVDQERVRVPAKSMFKTSPARHLDPRVDRLRVGYMSADFGGHTVGSLIRNLLKMHNRHRVEIFGIGMMKGDGTEWNIDMQTSVDRWLNIHAMTDHAAAFAVDALEAHILVDLNGHSKGSRMGVLLRRPAPILIAYLGYPSTSGGLADFLIADKWVAPPETEHLYYEKLVFLPYSYFVNDHRQLYPRPFEHSPTRQEYKLPSSGIIFGNFGQLYKVEPSLFDVWVRIIKRTSNTSLWLLKFPKEAVKRLLKEADKRGLPRDRLVLTSLLPIDSHLAIKAVADVALDTNMFNGHTTGADTLWSGLPLVSLSGEQMRSRAGASMAYALGVTRWLARSLEDYEEIAVRLASKPEAIRRAKEEMEAGIRDSTFFDTAFWAKGFERSWFLMWEAFAAEGKAQSHHLVASRERLEEYGSDWEPQNLMIGTSRHPRRQTPGGPKVLLAIASSH